MISDDLKGLYQSAPGAVAPLALRQGVLQAWDPDTGANTISVAGGTLVNVPVLIGETVNLSVGDVVALLTTGDRWFLQGKVTDPGDPGTVPTWTADITALTTTVDTVTTVTIPTIQNDVTVTQGQVTELGTVTIPAVQADADAAQAAADAADAAAAQAALDAAAAQAAADAAQAAADAAQADADANTTAVAAASSAASAAQTHANTALTAAQAAQATADGAIRTWYQSTAPTGLNNSTDLGDLWFDTDDNQAYRWNGTTWVIIEDSSIAVALAAAQAAQTTADGKITAYYQPGIPVVGEVGDLWYDTNDKNKPYFCSSISPLTWTSVQDGTIADAATQAQQAITDAAAAAAAAAAAQTSANGKNKVFYQTTAPTGTLQDGDTWFDTDDGNKIYKRVSGVWVAAQLGVAAVTFTSRDLGGITTTASGSAPSSPVAGDIWIDTANGNLFKRWSGSAWVSLQDTAIAAAQGSADGKNKIYYQATQPSSGVLGDTWFDTDDGFKIYVHNGTAWTASALGTSAIADLAITNAKIVDGTIQNAKIGTLDAGKITTGTLDANRIGTDTITATHIAASAITSSELAANSVIAGKVAADSITATELAANSVTASEILAGAVVAGKIAASAITTTELATGAVTALKIAANTITAAEIAADAITASELAANAVTAGKIAAGTIVAADIAADTITASQIAANAITATELATDSVIAAKIQAGAVTTAKIAADAVTANEIAAGTITATEIASGAITAAKLDAAAITGKTITGGLFRTMSSGTRIEIDSVDQNKINFYGTFAGSPGYVQTGGVTLEMAAPITAGIGPGSLLLGGDGGVGGESQGVLTADQIELNGATSVKANGLLVACGIQNLKAACTANVGLTTTEVDITGATITFTTVRPNAKYLVTGSFYFAAASGAATVASGKLSVDGSVQTAFANFTGTSATTDRVNSSQTWTGTLASAGSHTLKLRGVAGAAGVTVNATHTTITVMVFE